MAKTREATIRAKVLLGFENRKYSSYELEAVETIEFETDDEVEKLKRAATRRLQRLLEERAWQFVLDNDISNAEADRASTSASTKR